MLVYLKYCFSGLAFPPGKDLLLVGLFNRSIKRPVLQVNAKMALWILHFPTS
jgi:hypothetical protein